MASPQNDSSWGRGNDDTARAAGLGCASAMIMEDGGCSTHGLPGLLAVVKHWQSASHYN